jgi:hypothetical protein
VATLIDRESNLLVTSGIELTKGKHYWEVELLSNLPTPSICVGVCRPELNPVGICTGSKNSWFIDTETGGTYDVGGYDTDFEPGSYDQGDRVGLLLDLDDGSLRFFKNGAPHGPGFPAGTVTGPLAHAVQMTYEGESVRLKPGWLHEMLD